jgi:single-strand DNA-binding protein
MNEISLMGNVCRDIDLRHTSAGTAVCDVALAVNDRVKRADEWVDETCFVDVTCWGSLAEVAERYLRKGSLVAFHGRLRQQKWESEGQKRMKHKVEANKLILMPKRDSDQAPPQTEDALPAFPGDDEVPF